MFSGVPQMVHCALTISPDSRLRMTQVATDLDSLTVQPFLAVRSSVLNGTLADSFRDWFPGFRPVDTKAEERMAA